MEVGHITYKVDDLEEAVNRFRKGGFTVEYGKKKKPYNALIYFSSGPYLEILLRTGAPKPIVKLMKLFGLKVAERIDFWDNHKEDFIAVCLENKSKDLNKQKEILQQNKVKSFSLNVKRKDTRGRNLKCLCLVPEHIDIPFMVTAFEDSPKPIDYIHPNGAKQIVSVKFGCRNEFMDLTKKICPDETLKLFEGKGVSDVKVIDSQGREKDLLAYL